MDSTRWLLNKGQQDWLLLLPDVNYSGSSGSSSSSSSPSDCWNCNDSTTAVVMMNGTSEDGGSINGTNVTDWTDDLLFTGLTSAILGVLILATIIGNVFVIAAILLERHLHSVANYLIVSLAVADLLVACLVMPLGAVYEISQKWILGPELCDMWTSSDVLCCTASILHLVAIATDRYWAVTNVDYIHNRNVGRIGTMIFLVWAVALVVSVAPLFGWKDADFLHRVNVQQRCLISQDVSYQIFATFATFYVPLTVILIVYWKIFQTARKRIRKRNNNQQSAAPSTASGALDSGHQEGAKATGAGGRRWFHCTGEESSKEEEAVTISPVRTNNAQHHVDTNGQQEGEMHLQTTAFTIEIPVTPGSLNGSTTGMADQQHCSTLALTSSPVPPAAGPTTRPPTAPSSATRTAETVKRKRETLEAKRERKAAKTLAIITGAFVVCWLPFFVCALLMPLFPHWVFDDSMLSVFLWLGYFNSTLNPIIYTIFSPEFRQAFKRLLCGKAAVQTSAYRPRKLR